MVLGRKFASTKDLFLIIVFPLFLLLLSAFLLTFNAQFYNLLFELSNAHPQAQEYGQKTLDYLTYKTNFIQGFQQEEVSHMFEVRDKMFMLNVLFLILVLVYTFRINRVIIFYGSILNLVMILLLAILPFNFLFTKFHEMLAFDQWQFPGNYVMVQVFNQMFFQYFFLHIIGFSVVLSIVGLILVYGGKN